MAETLEIPSFSKHFSRQLSTECKLCCGDPYEQQMVIPKLNLARLDMERLVWEWRLLLVTLMASS